MDIRSRVESLFPEEPQVPPDVRVERQDQREYLLDGQIRHWGGAVQEAFSPICVGAGDSLVPKPLGSFPLMEVAPAMAAAEAAARAYDSGRGLWPTLPVAERIRHVEEFAFLMKEQRDAVTRMLMWEIAKTLPDAQREFDRTVAYIEDTIDSMKDLDRVGSRFTIQQEIVAQIRRAPLGVALCMGPYNYPLNETFTMLIPALIMGNATVFKPPRHGILLFRPLLQAFARAFPPGVVNTLYGEGRTIVAPLMASGKIDVLAFIGSSRVADSLKAQHPRPHRLRCVLGLEAKNPAIVLPDSDLDLTVKECLLGALAYNGQRCTAIKMIFVHSKVMDTFLAKFNDGVSALGFGMPWEPGVSITPMPDESRVKYLNEVVSDAVSRGARVLNPGGGISNRTFFYPAVLCPVTDKMRLWREEQFGPVVAVAPFDDIAEPIRYVIESNYGQQVSLFGSDPDAIARLVDPLVNQVCRVNLNSQCQRGPDTFPFTGRKDSAEGTLSVSDALRVFSIRTLVAAKGTEQNREIIRRIVRERKSNFLSTDFIL